MSEFRIVGGDVALDLVNTVEPRIAGREPERDHLGSPGALLAWAERADLIDAQEAEQVGRAWSDDPELAAAQLEEVRRLRVAVGTAVDAARARTRGADGVDALQFVLQQAASALARAELVPDPDGSRPARRHAGTQRARLIRDRLALAALEMLQTADLTRLKSCPPDEGGCGWVFLDTSRNGSRRWCSMEDCGTRVKSRRLTERRRDQRDRAGAPAHRSHGSSSPG